jgi:chromosome segregation ATPase
MKRFLGLIAMLFGTIGCILCLAGIILAWWLSYRYLGKAAETAYRVTEILSSAGDRVNRLEGGVRETQSQIASLGEKARQMVKENKPVARAKLRPLVENLASKVERSEDVAEALRAAAVLLHDSADLAAAFTEDQEKVQKIRAAEENLTQAIETIQKAQKTLALWQQDDDPTFTAEDVAALVRVLLPTLGKLLTSVADVQQFLTRAETEMAEVEGKITFWKTAAPALVTWLVAWIGVGQGLLLARGWSMVRPTPT